MTDAATPEDLLRTLTPQVVGVVARRTGDFDAAEDAVQEALLAAVRTWPDAGTPDNPRGWLIATAMNRFTDVVRSEQARRRREETAARQEPEPEAAPGTQRDEDDTLTLLFLCCHPALTPGSAIPLTLRAVGGLTTAEIARAFLVPETTMGQRISRAKQRVKAAGATFAMPDAAERPARLASVRHVLYLMFSEGYTSSDGPDLQRVELAAEAIRLARALRGLLPDDAETTGLLALMLLTDARREARTGPVGELVPLADQDRSRWDQARIREGVALVVTAMSRGAVGEYQLQAAIQGVHDEAPTADATDWPQILTLYGLLEHMTGNPVVSLNKAVAAAMVHGPAAGLAVLEPLEKELAGNHRLAAVRGHLHEMLGDPVAAAALYREAANRTTSLPEQHYLAAQAARLHGVSSGSRRKPPEGS